MSSGRPLATGLPQPSGSVTGGEREEDRAQEILEKAERHHGERNSTGLSVIRDVRHAQRCGSSLVAIGAGGQ